MLHRILSVLLLLVLPLVGAHAALVKGIVEVGQVVGQVSLRDAGGRTANLTTGTTFGEGHLVETAANSGVELLLSNGAVISLAAETKIEFKVFTQVASNLIVAGKYRELSAEPSPSVVQIELHRGKLLGEARKLNPSSQFTVKSPVAVTRVRGTTWVDEYTATPRPTHTTSVVTGNVETTPRDTDTPTPVTSGTSATFVLGSNPTVVRNEPDAILDSVFPSGSSTSNLRPRPPTGGNPPPPPASSPPPPPNPPPFPFTPGSTPFDNINNSQAQNNVSPSGG